MKILKKIGKVVLYIFLGIFLLLLVVSLFIDPIAKRFLENQVSQAGEGQFSLTLDEVDISILRGNFRLHGLRFDTDTSHHETPPIAFIRANEIAAEGVSWLTFLLEERLSLDEVLLDQLEVELYARQDLDEMGAEEQQETGPFRLQDLDIYPAIKDQVDRVYLKDLTFNDISFTLANVTTQDTLRFTASELHADGEDLLIDSDKFITDKRAFYSTYINFEGKDIRIDISGNQFQEAQTDFLRFRTDEEMLQILVEGSHFLERGLQGQDTLMFAGFQDFSLTNLDMKRLEAERTGHIENIRLTELNLINNHEPAPDTAAETQPLNLAQLSFGKEMPEVMDRVELDELDIRNVSVRQRKLLHMQDFSLHAFEMVVDEDPAFAHNRFLHAQELESSLGHLAMLMVDSMGTDLSVSLEGFSLDMEEGIGSIGFQELQVEPEEKKDNEMWVDAAIGPVTAFALNTTEIPNRQLSIDSIAVESPEIRANIPAGEQGAQEGSQEAPAGKQEFTAPDLYPAIADLLDQFSLGKLAVIGADIKLSGMEAIGGDLHIPALYMQLRDVLIAEGTAFEGRRVLHTEDIAFRIEDIDFTMPDDVYTVELDFARFSTFEQFFEIGEVNYSYNKDEEKQALMEEVEGNLLMSIKNKHFRINQLNFQELIRNQAFFAGTIESEGLEVYVHVDEHYPLEEKTEEAAEEAAGPEGATKMPQEMLKRLDLPLYLGEISLHSGHIIYEQLLSDADTAGVMELTDFFVKASNITNQEKILRKNGKMSLRAGAKIMDDGLFETEMVFDMLSDTNEVHISGTIDSLDLTKLNRYTIYTTRLALSSGMLHTLNWEITADQVDAQGKMEMSYEDLSMQISESTGSDTTGVLKDIGSFLANTLVLETDVPAEDPKEPEVVKVEVEKDENQGFIDYYVETLTDGLLELMLTISFLL